ncbi:MAG TPA: response regulator [bacterium]
MTDGGAKRILVVDDEADMTKLLKDRLERSGYRVETAFDGEEALARITREPPDLVILDLILPKLDGWRVCQRLKSDERTRHIPVVMLSAMVQTDSKSDPHELGDAYLGKPFELRALLERVDGLLGVRR